MSGEIPVPALCLRPVEAAIHAKYVYKVALNIKTFKALKYLLTLLSQDEELRCFSSLSFLLKKVLIFGKFKPPCKILIKKKKKTHGRSVQSFLSRYPGI